MKMNEAINHPDGIVMVTDRAVRQIASYAARSCDGVAGMSDKSRAVDAAKFVTGNADNSGVYVTKTKSGIMLELYVACKHGTNAKQLAGEIEEKVKGAFVCTGITVKDVSVHINDVR